MHLFISSIALIFAEYVLSERSLYYVIYLDGEDDSKFNDGVFFRT
jgi:hypothetical protein